MNTKSELEAEFHEFEKLESSIDPSLIIGTREEIIDRFHSKIQSKQKINSNIPNPPQMNTKPILVDYQRPPRRIIPTTYNQEEIHLPKTSWISDFWDRISIYLFLICLVILVRFYLFI